MSTTTRQLATFTVDTMTFGVELYKVQEVIGYQPMTPVPLAQHGVAGLINLRGDVISAIDLRQRLELPPRPTGELPMNVVVRVDDEPLALLVDSVGGVVQVSTSSFEEPPESMSGVCRGMINGVYKTESSLLLALDVVRAFSTRTRLRAAGDERTLLEQLPDVARPHMEDVVAQTQESCSMCVLEGLEVVFVARVATRRVMSANVDLGTRFPAYATAMGRVLLAAQSKRWLTEYFNRVQIKRFTEWTLVERGELLDAISAVREQRYALVDRELEPALRSLAVPVCGPDGEVIAAMNLSAPAANETPDATLERLLTPLNTAAVAVERELRGDLFG